MKARSKVFHCAAVDLGATSGRVVVGSWGAGRLRLTEVHRFANEFRSLGAHEYVDVPGLWSEIRTGLRKARKRFPRLASVGVDTWAVDHVLVDDCGRLVFPVHAYRDMRTRRGMERLAGMPAALNRIYAATGVPNVFYNSSLQLEETIARCPGIEDLATRCLFLADYFNFLLSGRMENEISFASTTQLLEVHGLDWSRPTLDYFRVPPTWLSKPILADTVLGPVRGIPELKGVTAVAVPGHDTACAFAAMPARPGGGDLFISSGTWSLVGFESDTPILGAEALRERISNERTGDGRYRPLTNVIGLWLLERTLREFSARPASGREWEKLMNAAELLPHSDHPLDTRDPSFANPPSMRAAIDAQLRKRRRPVPRNVAEYTRLICDSLGHAHAQALRVFERLVGRKFYRILIVGGGSQNRLLCQATADASGLPVYAFVLEGTAVGNIASQLVALRAVRSHSSFRESLAKRLSSRVYLARPG
ncbi:MAG TPA: FGGY-family carbohydrate kinase [Opitutaceae bacterium]